MDSTNFQHHEQQHHQQQQHLLQHNFVGCSLINNPPSLGYGVSTSLDWNNPSLLSTTRPFRNILCNKLYDNREYLNQSGVSRTNESSTLSNAISSLPESDARNFTSLPKLEEDMLSSFPSFLGLLSTPPNSMEVPCSFNNFAASDDVHCTRGFQSSYSNNPPMNNWFNNHDFPNTNVQHQLGFVSSPNNSTTSVSSTSPRLGLNLQAMDFMGNNNACFGIQDLHEEVISPVGKIVPNKTSAVINAVARTKRAVVGSSSRGQLKAASSNNDPPPPKKSQLKVSCPPLKVRKEKLGERVAALHQMVSPFGKTDQASVLTEAMGYIQFLQDQIHTLCMPHSKPSRNKLSRPFQMGPDNEDEGKDEESRIDLQKRGLCLVPVSSISYLGPIQSMDASNTSFY